MKTEQNTSSLKRPKPIKKDLLQQKTLKSIAMRWIEDEGLQYNQVS